MEAIVTRVDDLEVASFIDRISLFAGAGCNPQLALKFCRSSMECDCSLCSEVRKAAESAPPGSSPANILATVSRRTGNEALFFASLAFSAHLGLGVDIAGPLGRLAEVLRWHHRVKSLISSESISELAAVLFAYKMDFLSEIDKTPVDALAILAQRDGLLGPELLRIRDELEAGCSLSRAFARSAERTGSRGMRLLAAGIEVGDITGTPRSIMLRQTADAIRRELEI